VNGGVETAQWNTALLELLDDALHVVGPGRGGILCDFGYGEFFLLREGGRRQFDSPVAAWRGGHGYEFIHGDGQDEALVVVGVVSEQFQSPGRGDPVGGSEAELLLE